MIDPHAREPLHPLGFDRPGAAAAVAGLLEGIDHARRFQGPFVGSFGGEIKITRDDHRQGFASHFFDQIRGGQAVVDDAQAAAR